jgi:hypothetical protein
MVFNIPMKIFVALLSFVGLLWAVNAQAQTGCVPNPNNTPPPFVDGCPLTAAGLNSAIGKGSSVDPRNFGATCGATDSTSGIQGAINSVVATGGVVVIPCPMTVAGQLTLTTGGISLVGNGPVYYPGQSNVPGPPVWPPTSGPALNCTSTSVSACILINGAQGTGIRYLNLGNPQVFPPATGTWVPIVFPPLIATVSASGWQGLTIEHVSCNASYACLDIEGSPNYTGQFTGTQIVIRDIWCNPCINYGVKIHQIDNPFLLDHLETTYSWGLSQSSSGAYLRLHARGIIVDYCAACIMDNLDLTFGLESGIEFNNATVTNNFGSLTFAATAMEITNSYFNQVCQAMTTPGGNGTILQISLVNASFWGDQSGFACSNGLALINFNSNDAQLAISHANVEVSDTFINAGCGAGCSPGGGAIVALDDIKAANAGYSSFTTGKNFINAPVGTTLTFGSTNKNLITGGASAGVLIGPGPDSTTASEGLTCVGGGTNPSEGAACLAGSGPGNTNTGALDFYDKSHVQQGFVGFLGGSPAGVTVQAAGTNNVFIKQAGTPIASFGITGGKSMVSFAPLPTTPLSGTGSAYLCVDTLGNLYVKGSCP